MKFDISNEKISELADIDCLTSAFGVKSDLRIKNYCGKVLLVEEVEPC